MFDDYDKLVNKLAGVVETSPEDFNSIITIANELRRLDAARNDETRRFVNQVQEIARFTINRKLIEDILKQGRALIDAGDYLGALRKYREGILIYDYELREANFPEDIMSETRAMLESVDRAIAAAGNVQTPLQNARQSINALGANRENTPRNRQIINNAVAALSPQLDALTRIKAEFARAHHFYDTTSDLPLIDGSDKLGKHYYAAAALFSRGRANAGVREGLLGAVDGMWRNAVEPLSAAFGDIAGRLYRDALDATESGRYPAARTAIATAQEFFKPMNTLVEKTNRFTAYDSDPLMLAHQLPREPNDAIAYFAAMERALDSFSTVESIGTRFENLQTREKAVDYEGWRQNRISTETLFDELGAIRVMYGTLNGEADAQLAAINGETAAFRERMRVQRPPPASAQSGGAPPETPFDAGLRCYGDSYRVTEKIKREAGAGELAQIETAYAMTNAALKSKIETLEKRYAEGLRLLDGVPLRTPEGEDVTAKYSREAGGIFDEAAAELAAGVDAGDRTLSFEAGDARRGETAEIARRYSPETGEYTRRLRELQTKDLRDLAAARDRAGRAESLRIDGERTLAESRRALNAEDFDLARERLADTASRFVESLGLQENPALRRRWSGELHPLAAEITRLEYEYVVREVRGLLNTARDRYYAGTFDRAEESLVRAENRWSKVRAEPNDEIVYWLGIVRGALSLRSGSNVPITAPLYPEISQLLSDAKKNYREGVSLLETRREEGMRKFAQAKEKTQEVKLMFPVNQEAGMLELRIDHVIDPAAFEAAFRQRFVTAVAGTKRGEREPYLELENLAAINPKYPGIEAALLEAKYDVGLLQRPIDHAARNQAAANARDARRLYTQGANDDEVIRLAQAALRIDPNNTQAAGVLDQARLRAARGKPAGAATLVADPAAEQEYLTAVMEFQQGHNLVALARMQRLLRNPANQNNRRFNELLRRITAVVQ